MIGAAILIGSPVMAVTASRASDPEVVIDTLANEAIDAALSLPPGYKRDTVLRTVSRNLRWFGQPEAGGRAARAMTDGGVEEIPPGSKIGSHRRIPYREAFPRADPCDAGLWRQADGGVATTPREREAWAETCLVTRDFHWEGYPSIEQYRSAAEGLPAGEVKATLLMFLSNYHNVDALRFVKSEFDHDEKQLPQRVRRELAKRLAEPAILYRLGFKDKALASARAVDTFAPKADFIRLLITVGDVSNAVAVFDQLSDTPPKFGQSCFDWFLQLDLSRLGHSSAPVEGLGKFLDEISGSPLFHRICPKGLDAQLYVEHLLSAGRFESAIERARQEKSDPFLLIKALLEVGRENFRRNDRTAARERALEAAAALPPFDPGDPMGPSDRGIYVIKVDEPKRPPRNFGEVSGNTARRFEVIRLLAATGALTEADALARKQPDGALRAVALSAAVAGRAGIRFDDQAPVLSTISKEDL
ncbi:hypothetical protein DFR51_1308 [Sphingosinicella microcystinivorans]|nr:hypothetical protein DFR51_1308 [Sphingosinicella microcystinivorans]